MCGGVTAVTSLGFLVRKALPKRMRALRGKMRSASGGWGVLEQWQCP